MRGLIRFNFWAGAAGLAAAPGLWAMNGMEASTAVLLTYAIGMGLLLVSAGLWLNRRLTMNRAYAEATQRTVSNNYLRRQFRGRRNGAKPFLEPLGVNKGLRTYRPELVEGVETCDHPDYVRRGAKSWDCVRCSLTVIADRKPATGVREIV